MAKDDLKVNVKIGAETLKVMNEVNDKLENIIDIFAEIRVLLRLNVSEMIVLGDEDEKPS